MEGNFCITSFRILILGKQFDIVLAQQNWYDTMREAPD